MKLFEEVLKSPFDKCSYRLIELENKLQVLLITEPGTDKVLIKLNFYFNYHFHF